MVCLLVARGEAAEYDHVVIRDLEKTTAFEANPVRILFYFQVQRLPVIALLQIEFLNQVRSLTSVETSHNVQRFIIEGKCSVEISACV